MFSGSFSSSIEELDKITCISTGMWLKTLIYIRICGTKGDMVGIVVKKI